MITLLVRQGNQPEVELNVSGDTASVGRSPGSQVHLTQNYVSKKHLRVLKGIVIVDLGSANGTFLDGKRLKDPVVYTGGELRIGDGDVYMRVRLDEPADVPADGATLIAVPPSGIIRPSDLPQLKAERGESEKLTALLAEARKRIRELEERPVPTAAPTHVTPPAPAAPKGPSPAELEARAALAAAQAELEKLRGQIAAIDAQAAKPQVPQSPAAELFLRLQSENSTLKRKLAELQAKPGASAPMPVPAGDASSAKLLAEIVELRAQNAALRSKGATSVAAPAAPSAPTSNVRGLFARLAKDDVDRQTPLLQGSVEDFLVLEQFRLARTVERIVTRIAGDTIELIDGRTCLPQLQSSAGVNGAANLRQLITRLCESPQDAEARSELLQYCAQLSKWLVASLGAERKAATSFTNQLKSDLSEQALTARSPIPALKRLSGQADAELWRRASVYLRELTPDMIQDRLEKMTRAAVIEFVTEESSSNSPQNAS